MTIIVTFPYKIEYAKNNGSNKQALDHITDLLMKYKDADDLADIHHLKYLIDQTCKSKERASFYL